MNNNIQDTKKSGGTGLSGNTQEQKQRVRRESNSTKQKNINGTKNNKLFDRSENKKPAHPLAPSELQNKTLSLFRSALIAAIYLFAFIILDLITKQFVELPGVVAWYPPAGLTYSLLLVFGLRFTPAVTISLFMSSFFIHRMPQSAHLLFIWALVVTLIYCAAAAFLRRKININWQLRNFRDIAWFILITLIVSALLAILSVSSSAFSSDISQGEIPYAIFQWWIGESIGVLTVAPFLLIYIMPRLKRFTEGQPIRSTAHQLFPRPTLNVLGQAFSLMFILYWVFSARSQEEFRPLFLLVLPLIWIALQHGFKGVVAGIAASNFGVMLALWSFRSDFANLGELQLLMIINCIVGMFMGATVTERKQIMEELQKSRERYRTLFEESPIALLEEDYSAVKQRIFALQTQGVTDMRAYFESHPQEVASCAALIKILDVNKAGLGMFKSKIKDDMIGNLSKILSPWFLKNLQEQLIAIAEGKTKIAWEGMSQTLTGEQIYTSLVWLVTPDHEDDLSKTLVSIVDLTERKQIEEEIYRLNQELEQRVSDRTTKLEIANHELESFSYSVSHDLRAPLRALNGFSSILVEEYGKRLPQEARRYLDVIQMNSHKMGSLIDNLLLFSRTGKQGVNIQKVDFSQIVEQVVAEFQSEWQDREVEVVVGKFPACKADPALLNQVLVNLLSNAFKFTKGNKNARIEVGSKNIKGEKVYFVKDNGVGFDMRYVDKLFGVFQRLHSQEEFEGTGVGLAIVKRIIARHGGKVWAEAEINKGATFYFTIGEKEGYKTRSGNPVG